MQAYLWPALPLAQDVHSPDTMSLPEHLDVARIVKAADAKPSEQDNRRTGVTCLRVVDARIVPPLPELRCGWSRACCSLCSVRGVCAAQAKPDRPPAQVNAST